MFSYPLRYAFIILLSAYSYFNIIFTEGQRLFTTEIPEIIFFGAILFLVLFIWEGNRYIEKIKLTIKVAGIVPHAMVLHFAISLAWVAVLGYVVVLGIEGLIGQGFTFAETKLAISFGFRINLFLYCINAIVFFIERLKKSQMEAEHFKMESVEARLEALRSQINPHFLFNSFNVLSTLVYRDADTAVQFISQLSDVYRYLLSTKDNKVVKLREELEFLNSYLYLLRIRYHDSLIISNSISEEKRDLFLPPSTLQLLIENAIKHNVISKKTPLKIRIFDEGNFVVIANTLNPKKIQEPSTKVGLQNITSRYKFLSNQSPLMIRANGEFIIKVPLIEISET